jgi:hypothetical protein
MAHTFFLKVDGVSIETIPAHPLVVVVVHPPSALLWRIPTNPRVPDAGEGPLDCTVIALLYCLAVTVRRVEGFPHGHAVSSCSLPHDRLQQTIWKTVCPWVFPFPPSLGAACAQC